MEAPVKPLVANAADEAQIEKAAAKQKRGRDLEISDMCAMLATKPGRRFCWRYLETCGVFQISFNHSGSITAFNEGGRNIGLKLMGDIMDANPEAYLLMTKESKEQLDG